MKQATSIVLTLLFCASAFFAALDRTSPSSATGYKTVAAATIPQFMTPQGGTDPIALPMLPKDLLLDLAKEQNLLLTDNSPSVTDPLVDSLKNRISYLEGQQPVVKVKWKKGPAPPPVIRDTVEVPKYYLATQVGNKEGPSGECIQVYEVHQVDEICSGTTISSADGTTEYHIDVGD